MSDPRDENAPEPISPQHGSVASGEAENPLLISASPPLHNEIISASTSPAGVASEAQQGLFPPIPVPAAPIVRQPRNQQATMQADWNCILCVLRMCQDRALTGTPLHLIQPSYWPPKGDYARTLRSSMIRMIDDVFSTAVVEREDATQSEP
jgi:hypothetical protein